MAVGIFLDSQLSNSRRSDSGVLLPGNALFLRRVYYKEKVLLTKLLEGV